MDRQRSEWLSLLAELDERIKALDDWLKQQAQGDERVLRLQMHPGVGLLTSLALAHTLEPVSRFSGSRKVAAYVGLEPMERSSGERAALPRDQQGWIAAVALPAGGGCAERR